MASNSGVGWRGEIWAHLRGRNKRQAQNFSSLIQSHNKLFESSTTLAVKNEQLKVEAAKLKEENISLHIRGDASGDKNQISDQKLFKKQEELTESHRQIAEHALQIVNLNNALQEKEKQLQSVQAKILEVEAMNGGLRSANKNLEQTILELEATNQMLKDEHQALQLAFTALEEKYRKCQEDNRDLVERWMQQKSKDADKLNEENDKILRKRQAKIKEDLAEAAKEPVQIIPENDSPLIPVCGQANLPAISIPTRILTKLDAHESEVFAVKWNNTGTQFATGGSDRKIKLWEVINGKCENRGILQGSNAGITCIEFDIEERLVLGASNDFASRVWSLADHRLRHTLTGHSGKVLAAKFFGDTVKVVSGSNDRTLKIWDLVSRACIRTIFAGSSCNDLVTHQGTSIISGHFDKKVRFWDNRTSGDGVVKEVSLGGRVTSLDLSKDGNQILCCTRDDSLKILDLRTCSVLAILNADEFKVSCDWSRAVFSPDSSYAVAGSQEGSLYVWDTQKHTLDKVLKGHDNAVIACSWNPTGSSIVSCEKHRKVILWSDF
ncbi:autophagy-related protein 16-1 isoform X2 [Octopus bimaculoides]|nr:autophagy-related protein 16-1 isoform X2 [Octopus bimaculoides]